LVFSFDLYYDARKHKMKTHNKYYLYSVNCHWTASPLNVQTFEQFTYSFLETDLK
jgi:hypothetical protein